MRADLKVTVTESTNFVVYAHDFVYDKGSEKCVHGQ